MSEPVVVVKAADAATLAQAKFLVEALKPTRPLSLLRLEPDSVTGDPAPGAEARVADPAWLLGRQWQLGELLGEDAGSATAVTVRSRALPVTAWAPLDDATVDRPQDADWRPWHAAAVLEELVQDVPALALGSGLRQRAEAGAQLVELLHDAGADPGVDLAARYPLALLPDPADPDGSLDPQGPRLAAVLGGAVPDGGALAADVAGGEPAWVAGSPDPGVVRGVLADWLAWVTGAPDSGGAWSTERLEYRFALRFGEGADQVVTRGTQFGSAEVRWSDLDWAEGAAVDPPPGAPSGAPVATTATMLAAPLRYPAQPADRYWQLEDGSVDLGAIEAQPHDLARLALAEFALTSGDDWVVVPLDGLLGAVNQVLDVTVTDDFGDAVPVPQLRDPGFAMYQVAAPSARLLDGVVLPPTAAGTLVGEPVEEVLFLRDEQANMAWAVEQTVQGASGDPRARAAEPRPEPEPDPDDLDPDELVYRLQTPVPAHWIPLVPVALRPGSVHLRKGAFLRDGEPVLPRGVTLAPTPLTFPGEEVPRDGVAVRAVPVLARRSDGRYVRWAAYRVRTGRGEASSRLAWDSARVAGA
ncbi:hypothetical protein [Isoptericola sp. QY 916]|uniref:hypothetical protein n=1 Tax=Isoptericola sp. QY 916 TaxID=2782570 RepID=UPI003D2FABA6|nr:hypothetical protein [Isoptericola sp. QY 916]